MNFLSEIIFLVAVMIRFVWSFGWNRQVFALLRRQSGQVRLHSAQMQTSNLRNKSVLKFPNLRVPHLFIQVFRQNVDFAAFVGALVALGPQLDLGQSLIRERV